MARTEKKIIIGGDHTAVELKKIIKSHLESKGYTVSDIGVFTSDSSSYPDVATALSKEIQNGNFESGILICGTGIGISIAANKHKGIRAAACSEAYSARMSKTHNNANVICFGSRVIGTETAKMIVDNWLDSTFLGERHQERIDQIAEIENNN